MMQRFWPVIVVMFLFTPAAHSDPEAIRVAILGEGTASPELDLNGDGVVDVADLVSSILSLPKLELVRSSPNNGEQGVAITRETVLRFNMPLDPGTVDDQTFHAQAAGSDLPVNVHLSPDAKTVTIFYPDHLPPSARVQVLIEESRLRDADGSDADLDNDDYFAGTVRIEFDTLSLSLLSGTAVYGRVFASEFALSGEGEPVNVPLAGVRISIDGLEDTAFATTDENGDFRLEPVPAGRFFVHIDGRTVSEAMIGGQAVATQFPDGPYYPFVGKAWDSVANAETNIGNIYLPLVTAGSLQAVSLTEDTTIGFIQDILDDFPEFEGVEIMVPADSLFADDGTRGGSVGIAPVPPDRLPGELPPNLDFPIVITVQTDGATNFDRPVPVCFPNLPDPGTGQPLSPGAKSALWSFDHDTGRFSVIGPMTVSGDGLLVCTDPGVGILAPGWHGEDSGSDLKPPVFPGDKCDVDSDACSDAALWGAFDCITSFVPGLGGVASLAGCLASTAIAETNVFRDCAIGNRADCLMSTVFNNAGVVAGCLPRLARSMPGLGSAIACGFAAASIAKNCSCITKSGLESPLNTLDFITNLEIHLEVMVAMKGLYEILMGSSDWVNANVDAANLVTIYNQMDIFLNVLVDSVDINSSGGGMITPGEADIMRILPLAPGLNAAHVDAFVIRFNLTLDLWGQGLTTHEAAGRTDFIDVNDVLSALDSVEAALLAFDVVGAPEVNFSGAFDEFLSGFSTSLNVPAGEFVDRSHVFYKLTDLTNGFVFRGRFDAGGNFGIGGIAANSLFKLELFDSITGAFSVSTFTSSIPGGSTHPPDPVFLILPDDPDDDNDGLTLQAELVIGTFPDNPDSDGDGILDGLEVLQGSNPLDGFILQTGIIASIDTDGSATHVHASNDRVVLADGDTGVSLFNVYNGMAPVIIAQVSTGGVVHEVSASGTTLLAISDEIGLRRGRGWLNHP